MRLEGLELSTFWFVERQEGQSRKSISFVWRRLRIGDVALPFFSCTQSCTRAIHSGHLSGKTYRPLSLRSAASDGHTEPSCHLPLSVALIYAKHNGEWLKVKRGHRYALTLESRFAVSWGESSRHCYPIIWSCPRTLSSNSHPAVPPKSKPSESRSRRTTAMMLDCYAG